MVSDQAFSVLKKAANVISAHEKVVIDVWPKNGADEPEIEPLFMELETIKEAFEAKETMVEALSREVQSLQISVTNAHKRNFWALLSSASVIVAASATYLARWH